LEKKKKFKWLFEEHAKKYCKILQIAAIYFKYCKILQNTAKYCSISPKKLQNIARYSKILHDIAKYYKIPRKLQIMFIFLNYMFLAYH
jgi:hypothetical protein